MWVAEYEHGDISLNNLMYRRLDEGAGEADNEGRTKKGKGRHEGRGDRENNSGTRRVIGVLHDWDLATRSDAAEGSGVFKAERTGTIPFIALDVIDSRGKRFRRKYRHDLESFGWCLVHFCLDHPTNRHILNKWYDPESSLAQRGWYLPNMDQETPRQRFEALYELAQMFMDWLKEKVMPFGKKRTTWKEKDDCEIWDGVLELTDGFTLSDM